MNSPANVQINNGNTLQDLFTISDIYEVGNNANGEYIKLTNGYMICFMTDSMWTIDPSKKTANMLAGLNGYQLTFTFPATFKACYGVVTSAENNAQYHGICTGSLNYKANYFTMYYLTYDLAPTSNWAQGYWIALGTWR